MGENSISAVQADNPKIAVVIPTYNRSVLLRKTLSQLARQDLPPEEFEVIVADDGSSDDTRAVVAEFAGRIRTGYHFQEDLGFRAAAARNAGAKLAAAPVLVFLDTGAMVGPDFLRQHLRAHDPDDRHRVCFGYAYGYIPDAPMPGLEEILSNRTPEQTVAQFKDDPAFFDLRHEELLKCDFDLNRRALPWCLACGMNFSVRTDDFWAAGGFDEMFVGWGIDDLELPFRLHRMGLELQLSREAWAIEHPHERNLENDLSAALTNIRRFYEKHHEPVIEIGVALIPKYLFFDWEEAYLELAEWTESIHDRQVADEIDTAIRDGAGNGSIAVIGCGGSIPEHLPPAVLLDFDRALLDNALADRRHTGHHAIGLQIPLADQSVDTVIITSRLAGLRERWNDELLAEAHRIGRRVIDVAAS